MQPPRYSETVRLLAELLGEDPGFRRRVLEALRDRDERPREIWREMDLDGFLGFFEEWLTCMPVLDNEQSFLDDLLALHRTAKGLALVRESPFADWLNRFAAARGEFLDSAASRAMIPHWAGHPAIDMEQFEVPEGGYASFNEFFTRRLRPGARPIAAPGDDRVLVSPADSDLQGTLRLDPATPVEAKGMRLSLADLLPGSSHAGSFAGGTALVHFLDVHHYHRFHAPVGGRIVAEGKIGGLCFGCDEYPGQFFTEHHRGFFVLDAGRRGPIGMVTVGIATVSSVVHRRSTGDRVDKGEELGLFAYGGSAILLLFPPDRVRLDPFEKDRPVLMGSRIGVFAD